MLSSFPIWVLIIGASLTAFIISYVSIPVIVKISKHYKIFDVPNYRTSHSNSTPNLGGLSVFAGFAIAGSIFPLRDDSDVIRYILGGMIVLLFVGLKDDILVIDPKKKFLGQVIASLIIVLFSDIRLTSFHGIFGINEISHLCSSLVTLFLLTLLINGFNLIDGVDGLTSAVGIFVSVVYGTWFILTQNVNSAVLSFTLAGSLLAFFRFNISSKDNKIFLGDSGSMITGFIIAVFTIQFLEFEIDAPARFQFNAAPSIAIAILIIPLFDTLRVFVLRLWNRKSPFKADKNHIHHSLLKLGLSHIEVTVILISFNLLFVLIGYLLQSMGNILLIFLLTLLAGLLSCIPSLIIRHHQN